MIRPEEPERAPFAKSVVWRHPCDCPTASRPLEAGEEPEHRFDVDGAPFPWHIAENGASFVKHGSVYLVSVDIYPLERDGNNEPLDVTLSYWRRQPRIGEREFPWAIVSDTVTVTQHRGEFPVLRLTFIASEVDADCPIAEVPSGGMTSA